MWLARSSTRLPVASQASNQLGVLPSRMFPMVFQYLGRVGAIGAYVVENPERLEVKRLIPQKALFTSRVHDATQAGAGAFPQVADKARQP